jgi:hypothetical protein
MSVAFRPAGRSDNGNGKGGGPEEVVGESVVRQQDKLDNAQNKNKTNLITLFLVRRMQA